MYRHIQNVSLTWFTPQRTKANKKKYCIDWSSQSSAKRLNFLMFLVFFFIQILFGHYTNPIKVVQPQWHNGSLDIKQEIQIQI
jgi:hypothetical protein